ncbi:MAG: tetratricopeptide repeat protein [Cyanobacteria bacterium SBC]|nr:tetratricopeptide repeat protein [Cyanobacteria bacterium SBC]
MNLNFQHRVGLISGCLIAASVALAFALGSCSRTEHQPRESTAHTDTAHTETDTQLTASSWWSQQLAQTGTQTNAQYVEAISRGQHNLEVGHYTDAIADFSKAIEHLPSSALGYHGRALAKLKVEDYHGAVADLSHTITLAPDDERAYGNRGSAYQKLGEYAEALEDYNRAIEIVPSYTVAYFNRGSLYFELGEYARALHDFNQTVILNPQSAKAFYNRGMVYANLGDRDAAVADLETAEALFRQQDDFAASALALEAIDALKNGSFQAARPLLGKRAFKF